MKKILKFYSNLKEKGYSTLSGSIAFFLIVNGGSIIFLLIILFDLFNLNADKLLILNNSFLNKIITYFNENRPNTPSYYLLGFTSLWSSSTLFYHIIKAGEIIYEVKRKKFPLFSRVLSILLVLIFIVIILSSILVLILGTYIFDGTSNKLNIMYLNFSLIILIPTIIVLFFMLFIPPLRLKVTQIKKGFLFTMLFWLVSTIVFKIFLKIFINYKAIYGVLASFIILMIYIYTLVIGLVIGLIINYLEFRKLNSEIVQIIYNGDLD